MRESPAEVAAGAAVILAAAAFLVYAAQSAGLGLSSSGYDLTASFRSVEGVAIGTDVRMSGVKIGTVTGVVLNRDTFRAETVMTIDEGIPVPEDSAAVVASEGLLGGSFVEIVPGGSFDVLAPGAEILDTQGAVSLLQLLVQYVAGGAEDPASAVP